MGIPKRSIGQLLKLERESKKFSTKYVSKRLNIPEGFLIDLEHDDYRKLPEKVYVKNYIKAYCNFLGLNFEEVLSMYPESKEQDKVYKIKTTHLLKFDRLVKVSLAIVILLAVIGYLVFVIYNIFSPPALVVDYPPDQVVVEDPFIEIKGYAEENSELVINQQPVSLDQDGNFIISIDLQQGINMIELEAKKRFSNPKIILRQVIVK